MMYLNDPKTKKPSVSLTAFVAGFTVATFKLLVSGFVIGGFAMGKFTGVDFAAVVGALGTVYWARRKEGER